MACDKFRVGSRADGPIQPYRTIILRLRQHASSNEELSDLHDVPICFATMNSQVHVGFVMRLDML